MKKLNLIFFSLLCIFLFTGLFDSNESFGAENNDIAIAESYFSRDYSGYRYPILPMMSTWPYGNHQDMVNVCQIPDDVLSTMSTYQLLETVMAYPLLSDAIYYDSKKIGYETVKKHFKGLSELSKRDDRNACLEAYITNHDNVKHELGINNQDSELTMSELYDLYLSILLSSDDFEVSYDYSSHPNNRAYPTTFAYDFDIYHYFSNSTPIYTPKAGFMDGIPTVAKEYWNFSDGSKGWIDPIGGEFGSDAKNYINSLNYSRYGMFPVDSSTPSAKYNCHSYAWYSQTAHNYWVYFFNSSGYTPVILQNVNIDAIAVYYKSYGNNITDPDHNYSHSAIIQSKIYHPVHYNTVINLNLRSKWGMAGIYDHTIENCPYYYISETYPCDMMYYNP